MKKIFTLILTTLLLVTSIFAFGCSNQGEQDKVNIKYYGQASDIPPMILSGKETIGLVPEPAATALQKNAQKQGLALYRLDLQELYDSNEKAYPQAVLMVKKSVLGSHGEISGVINEKIAESVTWAKGNPALAVTAIGNHGATTLKAPALSAEVIDACKIYFEDASTAKNSVQNYVNSIIEIDSTKAKVVGDDFFYTSSSITNDKESYSFVMPDGAPALAVSKLMNDESDLSTGKTINYSVVQANLLRSYLVSGSADFVLAPVNVASQFYKENSSEDHYVMVAVVTHGNFYIISTEKISINDLDGKQIAVPMMGAVPDWTFKMVLSKHNMTFSVVE